MCGDGPGWANRIGSIVVIASHGGLQADWGFGNVALRCWEMIEALYRGDGGNLTANDAILCLTI